MSEKVKYMFIGAMIALTSFMLGNINIPTDAQNEVRVIDELIVRKLIALESLAVVDNQGIPVAFMEANDFGGILYLGNKKGNTLVSMGIAEGNGGVIVHSKGEEASVVIGFGTENGKNVAGVTAFTKNGKGTSFMGVRDGNGLVSAGSKEGTGEALLMINNGNGEVRARSKEGRGYAFMGIDNADEPLIGVVANAKKNGISAYMGVPIKADE